MRKLFLMILGLIIMAGTIFSPSKSWSFTPDSEVCFLSEHVPPGDLCILNNEITLATNQKFSALQTHKKINFSCNNCIYTKVAHNQELGVSFITNTCMGCSIANHEHDLIANGIAQKRVAILLC